MKSSDRILSVLWLFSEDTPTLIADEVANRLGMSLSTTYRNLSSLCASGLLVQVGRGGFSLGPAIIELDRRIRLSDPLIRSGRPIINRLLHDVGEKAAILLCRRYREQVMCILQARGEAASGALSYERGRPMALFRGAPSKAILANLPPRRAQALWRAQWGDDAPEGAGAEWEGLKAQLLEIRKSGYALARSEVDASAVGIAACVFELGKPVASICTVISESDASSPVAARIATLTKASADELTAALACDEETRAR
jgi:DNA-binding IclR family transcriptional regulator